MDHLKQFGWTNEWAQEWAPVRAEGLQPARVVADFGTSLKVALPEIHAAELTGRFAHYSNRENVPKVGDWVAVRLSSNGHAVIEAVIPRRSEIARKVSGKRIVKQVVAANIDIAFVLLALDNDFSVNRLERFLFQLSASHIKPVIVLNKADKTENFALYMDQLKRFDLPIIVAAAITGSGLEKIRNFIHPGETAILLGSSGVGKSTLTNKLLGREAQSTQAVRLSDSTGRHTTVHRELFMLPGGGLLIDVPGVREFQLWGEVEDLGENFEDIVALASRCKYKNCHHNTESGCAIQSALRTGALDALHYGNYLKVRSELTGLKTKNDVRSSRRNRRSHKNILRQAKGTKKEMQEEIG